MASKCTKCGNTDNYNFALNIGLCDICIGEELERIKKLKEGGYIRHKYSCLMGEYNPFLTGKGCSCGLAKALKGK